MVVAVHSTSCPVGSVASTRVPVGAASMATTSVAPSVVSYPNLVLRGDHDYELSRTLLCSAVVYLICLWLAENQERYLIVLGIFLQSPKMEDLMLLNPN